MEREEAKAVSGPKYLHVTDDLRALARSMGPGSAIDSERALMQRYNVSRTTIRRAIADLISEGVLEARHGLGTFVARERVETKLHLASFTQDMQRRGLTPSTKVMALALQPPPADVASYFGSPEPTWRLERLRLADGEPMAYEVQWINAAIAPELGSHDLRSSLYTIFAEHYDAPITTAQQVLTAQPADARIAKLLSIDAGAPVLVFERFSRAARGPVEAVRSWYRADRYRLQINLDSSMPS